MKGDYGYSILIIDIFGLRSHVNRFVRYLKLTNPLVKISLFSDMPQSCFSLETINYLDGFIKWKRYKGMLLGLQWLGFLKRWINYGSLHYQLTKLSRNKHFDIVNIHYPQYFMCYMMRPLRRMSSSIVVSPWGSDVLRLEGKEKRRKLARVFRKSDYTTVGKMGDIGKTLVNEMGINENKFHPLSWGSETIDYINKHLSEVSAEEAKRQLGLQNRYVITCGYNAFEEQRHETMIEAINSIKNNLPENLTLVFPLTYGFSDNHKREYSNRLKRLCVEKDLVAVYFEEYVSVDDLFLLKMATDMFVHIQTTDGGNSSLQEYVLCGKKVVHGTWMHYPFLEQYKPLFYFPVEDLEHLGEAILCAYYSNHIEVPDQVLDYIRNRGWKAKMKLWDDFFVSLVR